MMVGIGFIGEYVGRTYQVVRARQRYFVKEDARRLRRELEAPAGFASRVVRLYAKDSSGSVD